MDGVFDNGLANMPGPDFLVAYAMFAVFIIAAAYAFLTVQDQTDKEPPPATPSKIDPYEIAFLRGGVNEVIRTAIYALRQRSLIEVSAGGRIAPTGAEPDGLDPFERAVLEPILARPSVSALFKNGDLRERVESLCATYRARLGRQRLIRSDAVRGRGVVVAVVGGALLIALAVYKLAAAAEHGRSNVGFLYLSAFAACAILAVMTRRMTGGMASRRGKAYLKQLQLAYGGRVQTAFAPSGGVADGAGLVIVGLFGLSILAGTPEDALAKAFAQSSGGDGGGGGCGGGGGGGCGGCGGGGGD